MFNFLRKSEKNTNKKWIVYKDRIGNNAAIIRVDTSYTKNKCKHTLSVNIKYDFCNNEGLPNSEQKSFIDQVEDVIIDKIEKRGLPIFFIGATSFGGVCYLIFVTNQDVDWKMLIEELIPSPRIGVSVYPDDNMGYYNNILYPKSKR